MLEMESVDEATAERVPVSGTEHLTSRSRTTFNARVFASEASLVVGAAVLANVFSYLFHFTLSRQLGPEAYGTLATVLAIGGMWGVLGATASTVALQQTARLWASHRDDRIATFVLRIGRGVVAAGAVLAVVVVLAGIGFGSYVHIRELAIWIALGVWVSIGLLAAFVRGAAQGAHRFGLFSASLVVEGVVKLVLAVLLVASGLRVLGAIGGLLGGALAGVLVAVVPMSRGAVATSPDDDVPSLTKDSIGVLLGSATTIALLSMDLVFAKHHLAAKAAGYYSAAGTIARIIPYGVGLISLVLMPKAAAASHAGREALTRLLASAGGLVVVGAAIGFLVTAVASRLLISVTYGHVFAPAAQLLPWYGLDMALFALVNAASGYLLAVRSYRFVFGLVAVGGIQALAMAFLGTTASKLIAIGALMNACLIPWAAFWIAKSLRARTGIAIPEPGLAE